MIIDTVINFYLEVYNHNLIRTQNIIGFKNDIFNNSIMTPHFFLGNELDQNEIDLHNKSMGRSNYWLNSFKEVQLSNFQYGYSLQYVLFENKVPSKKEVQKFDHREKLDLNLKKQWYDLNERNGVNLNLVTQLRIENVIKNSFAQKVSYVFKIVDKRLIAGLMLIESSSSVLLLNTSVDIDYRGSRIFSEMLHYSVSYAGSQNKKLFYWTFNDQLKNKGDEQANCFIYSKKNL